MYNTSSPRVYIGDNGQVVTHEGAWKWVRLGRWLIVFIVIGVLFMPFPLYEPDPACDRQERQIPVETTVSGDSPVVHITVAANTDY
jgi:hypothetical protein